VPGAAGGGISHRLYGNVLIWAMWRVIAFQRMIWRSSS